MLGWALFVPVGFLLDPVFHRIGASLLQAPSLRPLWTAMYNTPLVPYTNFNNTVVLGSFVGWLVLAVPIFFGAQVRRGPLPGHDRRAGPAVEVLQGDHRLAGVQLVQALPAELIDAQSRSSAGRPSGRCSCCWRHRRPGGDLRRAGGARYHRGGEHRAARHPGGRGQARPPAPRRRRSISARCRSPIRSSRRRNLVEADRIRLKLNPEALAEKKLVVERLRAAGDALRHRPGRRRRGR